MVNHIYRVGGLTVIGDTLPILINGEFKYSGASKKDRKHASG